MKNTHILIICFSGRIGDSILMTPALRAISNHYIGHKIHLLAHKNTHYIFHGLPFINTVGVISRRKAFFMGRFSNKKYDYSFVFTAAGETPCVNFINYAKRVSNNVAAQSLDDSIWNKSPTHRSGQNIIDYFLQLPRDCGMTIDNKHLAYSVSKDEHEFASQFLRDTVPEDAIIIGLHLSSFGTRAYRDWPLNHYKELCVKLLNITNSIHFIIFGTDHDKEKVADLKNLSALNVHDCIGMTIRQSASIMSLLNLYITPDTGPAHIMSAFDKPMIVFYHCLHHSSQFLSDTKCNRVVIDMSTETECSKSRSMSEISVDTVYYHACALLGISGN